MGGQCRGRDADRMAFRAREQRAKLLLFVRKVEAVSGLRLTERRPVLEHEVEALTHVPLERLLGSGTRRRDGRENAAPFGSDLRVRLAFQAAVELVLAESFPRE